jgi:valyl-tRNA synthetase
MNVLLLSMPDSFEHMAPIAVRMPNGALTSIAGNVDPQHRVAVADLILVQGRVAATVERLIAEHQPDVVGLSVMTFQRRTALRLIERIRRLRPSASIVVGGVTVELDLSGAIDVAAERKRLEKDLAAARKERDQAQAKLGNEQFLAKAPEAVVDKIRGRLSGAESDVTRLEGQLAALPPA